MPTCCLISENYGPCATVFTETNPIARKPHRCGECGGQIALGEKYERVKGLWEGEWETMKTCGACQEIRDRFACGSWIFGTIWEDLAELEIGDLDGLSPAAIEKVSDMLDL